MNFPVRIKNAFKREFENYKSKENWDYQYAFYMSDKNIFKNRGFYLTLSLPLEWKCVELQFRDSIFNEIPRQTMFVIKLKKNEKFI